VNVTAVAIGLTFAFIALFGQPISDRIRGNQS
jgi:hypothetical protein